MFATPKSLEKRTTKSDVDRPTYIRLLLEEYESLTTQEDKKLQVLANLGNFAYDPINYEYFRRFNVMDVFLTNLSLFYQENCNINILKVSFSLGAICNLCQDLRNKEYMLKYELVKLVVNCLIKFSNETGSDSELIVLNSIMILIFVFDETTEGEIRSSQQLILILNRLCDSRNKQLSNVAKLFIQDYYSVGNDKAF